MTTKKTASAVGSGSTAVSATQSGPVAIASGPGSNSGSGVTAPASGFRESLLMLQQGVEAVIPDGSTIQSATGGFAKANILSQLGQWLAMYSAVDADRQQTKADLLTLQNALPAAHAYYTALKAAITGFYEPGNPVLTEFGFKPKKPPTPQNAATKAEAVVKRKQTRLIRNTLGPKARQKAAKFTGQITPAVVTQPAAPVAAPAAPAQGTAPAATPGPGGGSTPTSS
jgi:hypothetical protein